MLNTIPADADSMEALLGGAHVKDRVNIQKHLVACDAEPDQAHGQLWRRVALGLWGLAPLSVRTLGQAAVQFFIADGPYRMQVFTLEDRRNGVLFVYLPDVLDIALKEKVLMNPLQSSVIAAPALAAADEGWSDDKIACDNEGGEQMEYPIRAIRGQFLRVKALDAINMPDPPAHMKHMLGWKRRAIRVILPTEGGDAQIDAVEALCAMAARTWAAVDAGRPVGA